MYSIYIYYPTKHAPLKQFRDLGKNQFSLTQHTLQIIAKQRKVDISIIHFMLERKELKNT